MNTPIRYARQRGFTLIEVLLALGIAAVMFTILFMSLDQAVRARSELAHEATPFIMGPAILDVLERDLANAYYYDVKENASFYGSKASLNGLDADALSFIALSKAFAPDPDLRQEDPSTRENVGRYSYVNEVGYACRRGEGPYLELWRREDFYVDGQPHAGGEYILLYDRVHSLSLRFVSRNSRGEAGPGGGSNLKSPEEMLQEGWNSADEKGLPRAVFVTLRIFARDSEDEVDDKVQRGEAKVYTFTRYLSLPQIHASRASEDQVSAWDGQFNEATAVTGGNRNNQRGAPPGGVGARPGGGQDRRDLQQGGRGQGGRGAQGAPRGNANGTNPFLQALQNGGNGGARPRGGGGANISSLFGGGR